MIRSIRTIAYALAVLCLAASGSGCAWILEGPYQTILIHAEPREGIELSVNGEVRPFDDGSVELYKKRETHFVTLKKEGYQPATVAFDRQINPVWAALNIVWLPGYPIAMFIDWQVGALFRVDPREIHIVLRKKEDPQE